MRATTCWMPNVSRATRAAMMLELSPLETAANASARRIPAFSRTSWSKPYPVILSPLNPGPRPRNGSGLVVVAEQGVVAPPEGAGEGRADPAATHDHHVHGETVSCP